MEGRAVGGLVGRKEGLGVGETDGMAVVGKKVGRNVGNLVITTVGTRVGRIVGDLVGERLCEGDAEA